ncbi:MAG TPA: hypothetical protein VJZ50_12175 [Candidatus Limnocylindrales bacterium]|nr:hypothetical protein [Candidatus Limnocylindrales bacterium]
MHRHRFPSILATASLAFAVGSQMALAAVPESQSGQIGTFVIPDSDARPGVACTYDAGGPGAQGNDIDIMAAKGPRVFARDRTSERDQQTVGVKVIFQRSVNEGGSGGWVTADATDVVKKTAFDDQAAKFAERTWLVPIEEDYHFRALVVINWYKPGSVTQRQGTTKQRYVYYQVNQGGPQGVEQDRCLPEP